MCLKKKKKKKGQPPPRPRNALLCSSQLGSNARNASQLGTWGRVSPAQSIVATSTVGKIYAAILQARTSGVLLPASYEFAEVISSVPVFTRR